LPNSNFKMFMIQVRWVGRSCVLGCSEKHALFYILSFEGGAWLQGEERQGLMKQMQLEPTTSH
jgi:hypothetical protein